jgi:holo-ACP synthase/triphosphoribosyl-dephospho-CoA synthase
MTNIFLHGEKQDIPAVLANKDRRAALQAKLVQENPAKTVVAAKLNIPGPIKNNTLITRFFTAELQKLEAKWLKKGIPFYQVTEWLTAGTGPERFYLVELPAEKVKAATTDFEEASDSRRLFDLDVLVNQNGIIKPLSRADFNQPVRKCFVCGRPAKECGRARRHSVPELQNAVSKLIVRAVNTEHEEAVVDRLTQIGQQSLLDEMIAWPKPGLVDPVEHGAHPDMDAFTFINSSVSLHHYLHQAAALGMFTHPASYQDLFKELREFGKVAEQAMFHATNGVNTHKGAVFSLGILLTATANSWYRLRHFSAADIQRTVQKMLTNLVKTDLKQIQTASRLTAGERQYVKYGLKGIRGEAQAGYPAVFNYGLPAFEKAAGNFNSRIIQTFLVLALHTEDSALIKRAETPAILKWKDQQIKQCLAAGGIATKAGRAKLKKIEKEFSARHLSLGGVADLLIVTIFLGLAKEALAEDGLSD